MFQRTACLLAPRSFCSTVRLKPDGVSRQDVIKIHHFRLLVTTAVVIITSIKTITPIAPIIK